MTETTTPAMTTHTLEVPGAVLTYDVRASESSTKPVLLLIGSPMGAAGFGTLAGFFTDRTVVTCDPRMSDRSHRTDGATVTTVEEQADDLHRLISALGAGPVDLFASSGAAVTALALVAAHPEQVRTLVAHEPPIAAVLPDAEDALAACRDIHDTYVRRGFGAGMAKFLALVMHQGELHQCASPHDIYDHPADLFVAGFIGEPPMNFVPGRMAGWRMNDHSRPSQAETLATVVSGSKVPGTTS